MPQKTKIQNGFMRDSTKDPAKNFDQIEVKKLCSSVSVSSIFKFFIGLRDK
jgi:hypothetical protein